MKEPIITNIQRYSIHDGEGTRTTVFFKGCPLSCKWCHNPETQKYGNELSFFEERCTGCGYCSQVCPMQGIQVWEGVAQTDRERCLACGTCAEECIHNARELCGKSWKMKDLVKELLKDQIFYETSHGGVTLSGGEVLANDLDYITELMKQLNRRGISVYIDTCGAVPFSAFEKVLPYTDTGLYDLKIMDGVKHREYTGKGNEQILSNLAALSQKKERAKIWIRIPVIGGVNDTEENMEQTAEFLKENKILAERVNLLPYHNTGSSKYPRLSVKYEGDAFFTPSGERMEQLQQVLKERISIPVYIGG